MLSDKNEVARAWKKVNQVLKNCTIKLRNVNRFGGGKITGFGYDFTTWFGAIFPHGKIAQCELALIGTWRLKSKAIQL